MVTQEKLEQCVDKLYGALTAPETLVDAIHDLRVMFNASGATHLFFNREGELAGFVDDGHDPGSQQLYLEHYAAIDPTRTLLGLRPGEWLRDDRLLDPRHTTQPEFVNDFAPLIAMRWFLGCKVYEDKSGVASFSLQRGSDAPPFDEDAFVALSHLQPHLKRVFRMMVDTAAVVPALAAGATLDMLGMAVCVVDGGCRLVYANPVADELFARATTLTVHYGRLSSSRPDINEMLQHAVTLAARLPRQASAFSPEPHASAVTRLQVRAVPLAGHLPLARYGQGNLVLLFLAIGPAPRRPKELQQLFGLTRAEAELVELLAQGASADLCAVRRGVNVSTIRTQLGSIYEKTGAGSQLQLLSLVQALPAMR